MPASLLIGGPAARKVPAATAAAPLATAHCSDRRLILRRRRAGYLRSVRLPRYQRDGTAVSHKIEMVFHEGNSVLHKLDYEGDPRRQPLTYDEVQALFDAADA